jgi:hypothetical protein
MGWLPFGCIASTFVGQNSMQIWQPLHQVAKIKTSPRGPFDTAAAGTGFIVEDTSFIMILFK